MPRRRNKFGAKSIVVDNIRFASLAEARRYEQLKLLARACDIRNLELQPEFPFLMNGEKIFIYRADFAYFRGETRIVEDVKGVSTPLYRLKKKLIEAAYHIEIVEVGR
jgi:hypothetical protein